MKKFIYSAILAVAGIGFAGVGTAAADGPWVYSGFGNGFHDYTPHGHQSRTPFSTSFWYGNGVHDVLPHNHSVSPWGGVQGYSFGPFGATKSYNGFPSGGYYGGYAPPTGYYGWGW